MKISPKMLKFKIDQRMTDAQATEWTKSIDDALDTIQAAMGGILPTGNLIVRVLEARKRSIIEELEFRASLAKSAEELSGLARRMG